MSDKQDDALCSAIALCISGLVRAGFLAWSAWLEWHGYHDKAVWWLLFVGVCSPDWLKSIEMNTDRIPKL